MNYIDYFAKGGKTRSVNKKTRSNEDIQKLFINASGASTPEEFEQKWALCAEANGGEENLVATLNEVVTAYENASDEELMSAFKEVFDSATSVFKCGGKMQRLSQRFARGGAADCGCKKKIPMHQNSGEIGGNLRDRGTAASTSTYPDDEDKSAWTRWNGADVSNYFTGNTLEQHVIRPGIWGTPRRTIRIITNYSNPNRADTTYVDARGTSGRKDPTWFDRFIGAVHSPEFMGGLDTILEGYEPYALNEKETKIIEKNNKKKRK